MATLFFADQQAQQLADRTSPDATSETTNGQHGKTTMTTKFPSSPTRSSPQASSSVAASVTSPSDAATPVVTNAAAAAFNDHASSSASSSPPTSYENNSQYANEAEADQQRRRVLEDQARPLPKMSFLGIREDIDGTMVLDARVRQPWEGGPDGVDEEVEDSTVVSSLTDYTGLRSMYSTYTTPSVAAARCQAEREGKDPEAAGHAALVHARLNEVASSRQMERRAAEQEEEAGADQGGSRRSQRSSRSAAAAPTVARTASVQQSTHSRRSTASTGSRGSSARDEAGVVPQAAAATTAVPPLYGLECPGYDPNFYGRNTEKIPSDELFSTPDSEVEKEGVEHGGGGGGFSSKWASLWSDKRQRRILLGSIVILVLITICVSVGVAVGGNNKGSSSDSNMAGTFPDSPVAKPTKAPASSPGINPTQPPDIVDEDGVPLNDQCMNSMVLSYGAATSGTTANAAPAETELGCGVDDMDGPGVWYSVMGTGVEVTATTCGSDADFTTRLSIFEDSLGANVGSSSSMSCDALRCVAQDHVAGGNDDNCETQAQITWQTEAGRVYHILVRGFQGSSGAFQLTLEAGPTPNDSCSGAIAIDASGSDFVPGSTVGASIDNAPCDGIETSGSGVWYRVVGDGSRYVASTCWGTEFDTRISVFRGACGSLVCVGANDDFCDRQSRVSFDSIDGETYFLLVHGYMAATGNFLLNVARDDDLYNDYCTDARRIQMERTFSGDNTLAHFDFASTETCGDDIPITGPTVWYRVTGTGGELFASTCGVETTFDTQISVFSGLCGTLTCVGGNNDGENDSCGKGSEFRWRSVAFETYLIAVHGVESATGSFTFNVDDSGGASVFDTCDVAAGPVPLNEVTSIITAASALIESGLSSCNPSSSSSLTLLTGPGVWLYLEGDGGEITASVCDGLASGTIHVFAGASCSSLACIDGSGESCSITFESQPGEEYYLFISSPAAGEYPLLVTTTGVPPAGNDSCDGAIPLEINGDLVAGSTDGATADIVPRGFCGEEIIAPGVWFSVQGTGQELAVGLCVGTTYDSVISIFQGTCSSLECVGGNDDFCDLQSAYDWQSAPNVTYYILVHGFDTDDTGDFGIIVISNS